VELRPRYKQTEIGVIPEDWEVKPLSRISPRQSVGLVINPSTYFDKAGTIPLLVGSNVTEDAIDSTSANRITKASNQALAASRLSAGDLVTVRVGEPGTTAVVPPELDGCNCASMMIIRKDASFDSHWLCAAMNSQLGRRQVAGVQYGTAQKQFNISDAVDFLFAVPPLPEQRMISAALSDVDALLNGLDRLIAKKRDIKQAAMQQLLTGQTRLPGFDGEWVVKRLGALGDIRSGGTPSTRQAQFWDGDVPWCTPTDITGLHGRKYLVTTARAISAAGLQSSSAELLPPRSLIMTSRATIGECAINLIPMTTNQGFKNIVPFAGIDVEFLYYLMTTQKADLMALCGGSTFLEIAKKQLSAHEITLPKDLDEQTAIAVALSDMDAELGALEARREKTRDLKQAMLQELVTGKTRLVPAGAAYV
jgi:type I restriction enzyme, S subunit